MKNIEEIYLFLQNQYRTNYWKFCIAIFSLLIFIAYFGIWNSYFVQDEWYYFGLFNQFNFPLGIIQTFIQPFTNPNLYSVHFTPLWNSIFFLEYSVFGLHYNLYIIFSLILHVITSLLVVLLALKVSNNKLLSFLAGLFFAVSQSHIEAVTWANTHIQTQLPSMLVIISILLWIQGIEKNAKNLFVKSIVVLFAALFIKETVFGTFFLLGSLFLLFTTNIKTKKTGLTILAIGFFIYCLVRGLIPLIVKHFDTTLNTGPSIPTGIFAIGPQIYRLIYFPIKAIVQIFVPVDFINFMGEQITRWNYPAYSQGADARTTEFLTFAQSAGADIAMIYFGVILIAFFLFVYLLALKQKNVYAKRTYFFSILFIFFSVLPQLLIAPWLATLFSFVTFLDSRHFYLIAIGGSILFGFTITTLLTAAKTKKVRLIVIGFCSLVIVINMFYVIYTNWSKTIPTGEVRKNIVETITKSYPTIQNKAVFYITSDTPYYGFAIPMPPFQNNFGETLEDVYQNTSHFSPDFFISGFLIKDGIIGEGYKENRGKGFGYYLTGTSLLHALTNNKLSADNVYAFFYQGGNINKTTNITNQVRQDIKKLLQSEKAVQSWTTFEDKNVKFKFSYPSDYQLVQEDNQNEDTILWKYALQKDNKTFMEIIVNKNPKPLDIESYVSADVDSHGNPLRPFRLRTFTRPSMLFDSIQGVTVIRAEEKNEINIYIPQRIGNYVKQIRLFKGEALDSFPLKQFYRTIQFDY